MIAPPAEILEEAADSWDEDSNPIMKAQVAELNSFGAVRAEKLGATGLSPDFVLGYQFGLQVARTMIMQSAAIVMAGVKPEDVL
jgi:hypothetical protein